MPYGLKQLLVRPVDSQVGQCGSDRPIFEVPVIIDCSLIAVALPFEVLANSPKVVASAPGPVQYAALLLLPIPAACATLFTAYTTPCHERGCPAPSST